MAAVDQPFLIDLDESKGRVLVAKRPLDQGDLILHESPLVHGLSRDSEIVCFSCYNSVDDEDPYGCDICGLPLCDQGCQDSKQHKSECTAFNSKGQAEGRALSLRLLDDIPTLLDVIMIIRCLSLRQGGNDEWFKLNQLQSSPEDDELVDPDLEEAAESAADIFADNFAHLEADRETIIRIYGILTINSFEIPNTGVASLAAVYATGCLPEHNCVPSCHRSFDQDLNITLRAAVPLEANQRISITYTDSLWPTMERRSHLAYSKHFSCECARCTDPTETNTYLSALRCMKCTVGHYLVVDPLQETSPWCCEDCGAEVPSDLTVEVNNRVSTTIKEMEENGLDPDSCEKFLLIHSRMLHPQHAHMLDVKHSLLHLLGHHEGYLMADLTEKQLQIKEDMARCILNVADKIIPGISRLRGTSLYELFLTHQQRGLNWYHKAERGAKDVLSVLKTADDCLVKCIDTLQYEPAHQPEGKLLEQAREELLMLRDFVNNLTN
jgi:hypothetical protein